MAASRAWFPSVLTSWRWRWRWRAAVAAVVGSAALTSIALASTAPAALAGTTATAAAQRVIATVRVGNGSTSLTVDPRTGAVYVVNEGSRTVTVLSGRTSKVATTVPIRESSALAPCAVTVSPVTGDVYVSSCVTGATKEVPVTVLSGRTNKVIATLQDGGTVEAISPVTGDVYLGSYFTNTVKVLSGQTNKVIATIPNALGDVAISPRTGEVYLPTNVNEASGAAIIAVNGRTNKVAATIKVDGPPSGGNPQDGVYPQAIAVSPVTGEIYVFSTGNLDNNLTVIDAATNKISTTVSPAPEGFGGDQLGVGRTGTVYVSGSSIDTMAVINGKTNTTVNTLSFTLGRGVMGSTPFATSPQTGDAYVPDIVLHVSGHDEYTAVVGVSAISAQTGKITSTIRLPRAVGNPDWGTLEPGINVIAVSPVTGDVYTLNPVNAQTSNPKPEYEVSVISG